MSDFILPHALPRALDRASGTKLLSLDCFDTLLWRDTHAPRDIFHLLPGITMQQRTWAESRARRGAILDHRRNEVSIEEVYAELLPNADANERAAAIAAEIDAEARHCFAFAPTVALMRAAKARGLKVVIVSDTYFSARQLSDLIRRAAGDEVMALVDRIFASSEHGLSKSEGLFGPVLKTTGVRADRVLHIGDNPRADFEAARAHGLRALHLRQFAPETVQRLRLEAAAGGLVHAGGASFLPHRAATSVGEGDAADAAEALGRNVLGPVLTPFLRWIADEGETLAETRGGRVHRLFLMRDGYLPHRVAETIDAGAGNYAIDLSRFTAIAASLTSEDAVRRYVQAEIGNGSPADLMQQLLFAPDEIAAVERTLPRGNAIHPLHAAVTAEAPIARTVARSVAFGDRLEAYLHREVAPRPGDTLMLVDLGYNGTVQNHIEHELSRRLGVRVAGRYLLLREQDLTGLDKRGFIDARHYDGDTLEAFSANVAVLEQLCTAAQGSVIDYSENGEPIRSGNSIKARQSETREATQRGCIEYAKHSDAAMLRANHEICEDALRRGSASVLARLMFLPQPEELAVLEQFEHDVNLGGEDLVKLFDPHVGAIGLKERGLFYLKNADRMYLPAELRGHGLPLNMTLLTQRRFGLDLRYADFCDHGLEVPILIADGRDVTQSSIRAVPTHDGHYLASVPVGASRYAVGLQFGKGYEWLQILSARFAPVEGLLSETPQPVDAEVEALPSLEGMEQVAPHLFRCHEESAFLMVPPTPGMGDREMVLHVAFRPLVPREPSALTPAKSAIEATVRS